MRRGTSFSLTSSGRRSASGSSTRKRRREECSMRHGLRFSFALSEFTTAAALITVAACGVGYFMKHPERVEVRIPEPTVVNHYITVPAPQVRVRVVIPKPPELPKTNVQFIPSQPKVWDND